MSAKKASTVYLTLPATRFGYRKSLQIDHVTLKIENVEQDDSLKPDTLTRLVLGKVFLISNIKNLPLTETGRKELCKAFLKVAN